MKLSLATKPLGPGYADKGELDRSALHTVIKRFQASFVSPWTQTDRPATLRFPWLQPAASSTLLDGLLLDFSRRSRSGA